MEFGIYLLYFFFLTLYYYSTVLSMRVYHNRAFLVSQILDDSSHWTGKYIYMILYV